MANMDQIGKHQTVVSAKIIPGYTCVMYWDTVVVKFNNDSIILDSGGWYTKTTKLRMNQASVQFDLGYTVFQKKGVWSVQHSIGTSMDVIPFEDGLVLVRGG